jgi:predicted DNA-binding transcriptional regulator AlpA
MNEMTLSKELDARRLITSKQVLELCGGIAAMTLWRWIKDGKFPKPIYIATRRYWTEAEVIAWLQKQSVSSEK